MVWVKSFSNIDKENKDILRNIMEKGWPLLGQFYSNCLDLATMDQLGTQPIDPIIQMIKNVNDSFSLFSLLATFSNNSIPGKR